MPKSNSSRDQRIATEANSTLVSTSGFSKDQVISITDLISEGEIEGLVNGEASIFLNDDAIVDSVVASQSSTSLNNAYMEILSVGATEGLVDQTLSTQLLEEGSGSFRVFYLEDVYISNVTVGAVTSDPSLDLTIPSIPLSTSSAFFDLSTMGWTATPNKPDTVRLVIPSENKEIYGFLTITDSTNAMFNPYVTDGVIARNFVEAAQGNLVRIEIDGRVFVNRIEDAGNNRSSVYFSTPSTFSGNFRISSISSVQIAGANPLYAGNLKKFEGVTSQVRYGTIDQPIMTNFGGVEGTLLTNSVSKSLNSAGTTVSLLSTSDFNLSAAQAREVDEVRVLFSYGSMYNTSSKSGNTGAAGVALQISIDIYRNSTDYTTAILAEKRIHSGEHKSPVTFEERINLEPFKPFSKFTIKVKRLTRHEGRGVGTSGQDIKNKWKITAPGAITFVTSVIKENLNYPLSAYANVTFSSKEFDSIPTRTYHTRGLKVKVPSNYTTREASGSGVASYSGLWNGTFKPVKEYTNNPAWVFYDILTNNRYGLGEWIDEINIDKYSLYRIAKYCDELVDDGKGGLEPRFTSNIYLTKSADAYKVLKDMASTFLSMLYWMDGKITTVIDQPKDAIYTFSKANVIDGAFTYETTGSKTRANQVIVSWNNPDNDYVLEPLIVEDRENIVETGRIIVEEASAFGCTSEGQAYRYGKWKLWTAVNQTRVVSFSTSINAAFLTPGDIIKIQDADEYNIAYSGRVSLSGTTTSSSITLDRTLNLNAGSTYYLSVLLDAPAVSNEGEEEQYETIVETRQVTTTGTSNILQVSSAFSQAPKSSTVWVLREETPEGVSAASAKDYKILAISEDSTNKFNITAVEHYNEKFTAVENDFSLVLESTVFPKISSTDNVPAPRNLYITETPDYTRAGDEFAISWDAPVNSDQTLYDLVSGYEISHNIPGYESPLRVSSKTTSFLFTDIMDGVYYIGVRTVNTIGNRSGYTMATLDTDNIYESKIPRAVGGIPVGGNVSTKPFLTNTYELATSGIASFRFPFSENLNSFSISYPTTEGLPLPTTDDVSPYPVYYVAASTSGEVKVVQYYDPLNPSLSGSDPKGDIPFWLDIATLYVPTDTSLNNTAQLANWTQNFATSSEANCYCSFTDAGAATLYAGYNYITLSEANINNLQLEKNDIVLIYSSSIPKTAKVVSIQGTKVTLDRAISSAGGTTRLYKVPKVIDPESWTIIGTLGVFQELIQVEVSPDVFEFERKVTSSFTNYLNVDTSLPSVNIFIAINTPFLDYNAADEQIINYVGSNLILSTDTIGYTNPEFAVYWPYAYDFLTGTGIIDPLNKTVDYEYPLEEVGTAEGLVFSELPFDETKLIWREVSGVSDTKVITDTSQIPYDQGNSLEFTVYVREGGVAEADQNIVSKTFVLQKIKNADTFSVKLFSTDYSIIYDRNGANPVYIDENGVEAPNSGYTGNIKLTAQTSGPGSVLYRFTVGGAVGAWQETNTTLYPVPSVFTQGSTKVLVDIARRPVDWDDTDPLTDPVEESIIAFDEVDLVRVRQGTDALTIIQSNSTHTVSASNDGNTYSLGGSGTSFEILEGGTPLDSIAFSDTLSPGKFKLSATPSTIEGTIGVGSENVSTNLLVINDHTADSMTNAQVVIKYDLIGQRADGTEFTATQYQTLSKSLAGVSGNSATILSLYKAHSSGSTAPTDLPNPATVYKYDFTTGNILNDSDQIQANINGWTQTPPALTDTNKYLWRVSEGVQAAAGATIDENVTFDASPVLVSNIDAPLRLIELYQLGNDLSTAPDLPEDTLTYNFLTNSLSGGNLNNWSRSASSVSETDKYLWKTNVVVSSIEDTVSIEGTVPGPSQWDTPIIVSAFGVDSRAVKLLPLQGQVVVYDGNGTRSGQSALSFKAIPQNFSSAPTYTFKVDGVAVTNTDSQQGTYVSGDTLYLAEGDEPAANGSKQIQVEAGTANIQDTVSIYGLKSGSDVVTGFLTNEAHVEPADFSGNLSEGATALNNAGGTFVIYKGSTLVTATDVEFKINGVAVATTGSPSEKTVNGLKISINENGVYSLSEDTDWNTAIASFTLEATYDNVTISKVYTISKSIAGNLGSDAKAVKLLANQGQVVLYDGNNIKQTHDRLTFTALAENYLGTETFKFYIDSVEVTSTTVGAATYKSGATLYLAIEDDPSSNSSKTITVEGFDEGVLSGSDTVSVYGLKSGSDVVTGFLTNEAHVEPANSSGALTTSLTNAGGTFVIYKGSTPITGTDVEFKVNGVAVATAGSPSEKTVNGLKISINENGVYSLSEDTDWNTTIASFTLEATYDSVTISKVYTISKSTAGSVGADAKAVKLVANQGQTVIYNGDGTKQTHDRLTFTALPENYLGIETFKFYINGTEVTSTTVGAATYKSGDTLYLALVDDPNVNTSKTITVEGYDDDVLSGSDTVSVYGLKSGQDALVGFLTNEAHVEPANSSGALTTSLTNAGGTFVIYKGSTPITGTDVEFKVNGVAVATAGAPSEKTVNGLKISINENGVYSLSEDTDWTTAIASFTLEATYDNVTISKVYTISKSTAGSVGADAKAVKLVANQGQTVVYDGDGTKQTHDRLTFTALPENYLGTETFKFYINGTEITSTAVGAATYKSGDTLYLALGDDPSVNTSKTITVEGFDDGVLSGSDTVSVYGLKSGQDALVGFLTNEVHVEPADNNGTLTTSLSNAGGTFKVFKGEVDVTASCTFTISSSPEDSTTVEKSDLVMTIGAATGVYSLSQNPAWTSALETFTLKATYGTSTLEKVYTISKSIKGDKGDNPVKVTAIELFKSYSTQQASFSDLPTGTFTYNFDNANLTGGTNLNGWSLTAPGVTPTNRFMYKIVEAVQGETEDTTVDLSNNVPVLVAVYGEADPSNNYALLNIYRASSTAITDFTGFSPDYTGTKSYTFAEGDLETIPNWSESSPVLSATNKYIYKTAFAALSTAASVDIADTDWDVPVLVAQFPDAPADPADPDAPLLPLRTTSGVVYYQLAVDVDAEAPAAPTATSFNFLDYSFTGLTANWALTAPTNAADPTKTYYYSRFTATEERDVSNVPTGTDTSVTFEASQKTILFTGLVTFSGSTIDLSETKFNTTTVDGSTVTTGVIRSNNYTEFNPPQDFSETGSKYNLLTGEIQTPYFFTKGDAVAEGSAGFKGTLYIGSTTLNATNTLNENTTKTDVGLDNVENKNSKDQLVGAFTGNTEITGGKIVLGTSANLDRVEMSAVDNTIKIYADNGAGASVLRVKIGNLNVT